MKPESFAFCLLILCAFLSSITCSTGSVAADAPSSTDTVDQKPIDVQKTRERLVNLGFKSESIALASEATVKEYGRIEGLFESQKHLSTILDSLKWKSKTLINVPLSGAASAYCELAWFLDVVNFDDAVDCLRRNNKEGLEVEEKLLINLFADRHAFELSELLQGKNIDLGDEVMLMEHIQGVLSLQGIRYSAIVSQLLIQHTLKLMAKRPTVELEDMLKHLMTLHLSAFASDFSKEELIGELYAKLKKGVSTLFKVSMPRHAATVVVTRMQDDTYEVVIINSGSGLERHQSGLLPITGFHTQAFGWKAMFYNPLLKFSGLTYEHLKRAKFHFGTEQEVYYDLQADVKTVRGNVLMPWQLADAQGIGSCTATSIWYTLRYYYKAYAFEAELRLSILDQALTDLVSLQSRIAAIQDDIYKDILKRGKQATSAPPIYDKGAQKLWDEKDELEQSLQIRRSAISVGLNGILQNLLTMHSEAKSIELQEKQRIARPPKEEETEEQKKKRTMLLQRFSKLQEAAPRILSSFGAFWAAQDEQDVESLSDSEQVALKKSWRRDSWAIVQHDVRSLYFDALKLVGDVERFKVLPAVRAEKPINVESLMSYDSLRILLQHMLMGDASASLKKAIDVHLENYGDNAAANYLLVLYAALARSMSLLEHLVVTRKLPLLHPVVAAMPESPMLLLDLTDEAAIASFAAQEFAVHGQPLDSFPELFGKSRQKTAAALIEHFKEEYGATSGIKFRSDSWTTIDKALAQAVEADTVPIAAYLWRKATPPARLSAFVGTNSASLLRFILENDDLIEEGAWRTNAKLDQAIKDEDIASSNKQFVEQLLKSTDLYARREMVKKEVEEGRLAPEKARTLGMVLERNPRLIGPDLTARKLGQAVRSGDAKIVQLVLPHHIHLMQSHFMNQQLEEHIVAAVTLPPITVPQGWIADAIEKGPFWAILEELLPYSDEKTIKHFFLKQISSGDTKTVMLLSTFVDTQQVVMAIEQALEAGHLAVAHALLAKYPSQDAAKRIFLAASKKGYAQLIGDFVNSVPKQVIDKAIGLAGDEGHFACVAALLEYADPDAIESAVLKLFEKDMSHPVVRRALSFMPSYTSKINAMLGLAIEKENLGTIEILLPFVTPWDLDIAFEKACQLEDRFRAIAYLLPLVSSNSVNTCFKGSIERATTKQTALLLPRTQRRVVYDVFKSSAFEALQTGTKVAIEERVKSLQEELEFEASLLIYEGYYSLNRRFIMLRSEAKKYGIELASKCLSPESCMLRLKESLSVASPLAIDEAFDLANSLVKDRLLTTEVSEDVRKYWQKAALTLLPHVSPEKCTSVLRDYDNSMYSEFAEVCSRHAQKSVVASATVDAMKQERSYLLKLFARQLTPIGVYRVIDDMQWYDKAPESKMLNTFIKELEQEQIDLVVRLLVRDFSNMCKVPKSLLKRTSTEVVDVCYMRIMHQMRKDGCACILSQLVSPVTREKAKAMRMQLGFDSVEC